MPNTKSKLGSWLTDLSDIELVATNLAQYALRLSVDWPRDGVAPSDAVRLLGLVTHLEHIARCLRDLPV